MRLGTFRGHDGVWGGDLTDPTTPVAMRDKIQHLLLGQIAQMAFERWVDGSPWWCALFVLLIAVLVELVEQSRFDKYGWDRMLSDEFDVADVVATFIGGILAWLLL